MLMKDSHGVNYEDIMKVMRDSYQEFRSLKGNQGTFARTSSDRTHHRNPRHRSYQRGSAADPIEEEDECEDEESVQEDPESYDVERYAATVCDPDSAAQVDDYEYHVAPAEGILDAYGKLVDQQ